MSANKKHVVVVGAGVAGMTASDDLARSGFRVSLFEKSPFLGGHAIELNCKATDACVKCGACVAEEKLMRATGHSSVAVHLCTDIQSINGNGPFNVAYRVHSPLVNADRCNGCGLCFQKCPVPGTLVQGRATRVGAYVAIRRELCRYFDNAACTLCRDTCPQGAIELAVRAQAGELEADAVLVATGFAPYNPIDKPYGYGQFENVITSLDAERLLREHGVMKRPSDGKHPKRLAFIQCVGSRDTQLGHPWCSKICCGSSLRMARLIQSRQNDIDITFFYIDVQTFGKEFQRFYAQVVENVEMVRAIPGEITRSDQNELNLFYFDPDTHTCKEAVFDVVVLSVGLVPGPDSRRIGKLLDWPPDRTGFLNPHHSAQHSAPAGIFTSGAAVGPMSIAESVSSAEKAVFDIVQYLSKGAP
ncbi:MAG: FAD-dependent oxidoreductase [Desulfobacteraceae bacterium]